ncbi:MAG: malto-oligosyltrehalose trehalohydrolase [Acidimicrobiia bacterium]
MELSVWAPRAAASVEVVAGERRVPLAPEAEGWWRGDVPGLRPGVDYALSLDRGPPLPDPRSAWQPHGPHGPSRVVDHDAFGWTDDGWPGVDLAGAVLYELHVGTFSPDGTFDGAIDRLDHLVDLGVDAVELMPVAEFPGRWGWGYDGVALWAAHSGYGGPEGLKRLVDACHARALGVIVDVVHSHVAPASHLGAFGPYAVDGRGTRWGAGFNIDGPGSDDVRGFLLDNALLWLREFHADGLRLDAVHAIVDTSALHLLEELGAAVRELGERLGRPLWLVAECDRNDPRYVRSVAEGGYEMDAAWSDDWHHALHAVLTGERQGPYGDVGSLTQLAKALRQAWVFDGLYSPWRGRTHGRPPEGLHGAQFVVYAQNHDQAGNRPGGDRLGQLVSGGRSRAAAALLLTSPFVPMLFQGEEWGASTPFHYMTDHTDPEVARAARAGRRRELARLGWTAADVPDPQDPAMVERSRLRWAEVGEREHADLLGWYRALVALRHDRPGLAAGPLDDTRVTFEDAAGWLVAERRRAGVAVAVNLGSGERSVPVPEGEMLLAHGMAGREAGSVTLAPDGVGVIGRAGGDRSG